MGNKLYKAGFARMAFVVTALSILIAAINHQ